nr:MAG TPA: NYN ribonuclease and ATPase [Bacteriophage sp.]
MEKPIKDKVYFYDTNAILDLQDKAFENYFYISSVTLEELEHIKTSKNKDDEVKYLARKSLHLLDERMDSYECIVYDSHIEDIINNTSIEITPDSKIVACCYYARKKLVNNLVFYTNDISCKMIAKQIFGLPVESSAAGNGHDGYIYKGYKEITGNTQYINQYMENIDLSQWYINEYLIIRNIDDGSEKEMRFDGEKFVALKLPPSRYIKAKNSLQRCALDILNNPDITIAAILGGYGSGKTFVSMQMALYNIQEKGRASKILGVREFAGEGKEIGALPGDMEDKVGRFFDPLTQSLNGGEFELQSLKMNGVLDTNIPFFMKGTTYNETIIICDEAEDLTESQIRLIGTRLGTDSRIYLAGDYKQSLLSKTNHNPLIKMCNEFKGNKKFGCIYLGEDVRSETSKMFAELFDK